MHYITLYVIDIHNIRCLKPFFPLYDYFEIWSFWDRTGSISWNLVLKAQSKPQTSLKDLPGRFAPAQWPVAPDPELTTPTLHGWYEVGDEVGDIWDIANKSMHEKIANKFNVLQKTAKKLLNQIRNWQISSLILSHPQRSSTVALRRAKNNLDSKKVEKTLLVIFFSHRMCLLQL